jgi:hypothetical protein
MRTLAAQARSASPPPSPRPTITWPAIAIASRTKARKIQSWNAIWCAASDASPNRAITAPASVNALRSAAVRTKMWRPITRSRRISTREGRVSPAAARRMTTMKAAPIPNCAITVPQADPSIPQPKP